MLNQANKARANSIFPLEPREPSTCAARHGVAEAGFTAYRHMIVFPPTRRQMNHETAGVALTGDPDYRIVMEAYPFVTRKIISDDSPALQRALRDILYR